MTRRSRIVLAVLAVAAVFGYRQFAPGRTPDAEARAQEARHADAGDADAAMPIRRLGRIAFRACSLPALRGDPIEAQCARFEVPEDPARADGRKLSLNIAWLPATEEADLAPDPVFFLAGGPGQAAVESYPSVDPAFAEVRRHRHVVLVDQRGTGGSNRLDCPRSDADDLADDAQAIAALVRETEACRDALAKKADLAHYTTSDAVRDLDAVRQAIGASQVNLVGVSYGTRVAQQYAMRHPQAVRSVVLDSVVPNTLVLGNIFARNLDDALALQFGRCSRDAACRGKLGDPRRELDTLLAKLRTDPPLVRYRDATTGEYREDRLVPGRVAGLVRMYAYMPTVAGLLPVLVHDANRGRYEGLMALSQMLFGQLEDQFAMGMQLSVVCSEDGERIASSRDDAGTVLGHVLTDAMAAQCRVWPRGATPADFRKPLSTPTPTLVLEGEYDPVTPPRYGREVAKALPRGRLFVLRGQGHNVIGVGCMPRLFAQFVDTADAGALDGSCLDTLAYAAPFTGYNGWEP